MAVIPSTQGAPQASNIAIQDALATIGSLSRENGQTVLNLIDAELAKLFEDRNLLLAEGGTIAWSTTTNNLTFSASLKLHINSQVAGGSPTIVDLASTTRAFSADGNMLYAVVNRIAGTATVTADATTLPSVVAANLEVILLAKRVGTDIYFRNGFRLGNGQSAVLGRTGSVVDTEFVINDATDPTKQIAFDAAGTTATSTIIQSSQTANRTQTLQDATDTFVYRNTTDQMTNKQIAYSSVDDSTTTGSNATAQAFTAGIIRLTNSSLVSLSGIPAGSSGQFVIVENKTGNQISVNNEEATATAANRIQTGNGANVSMPNNSTFMFTYDATTSRWQLSGGSGSGSGTGGSKNYLSAITTSQSTTPNTGNGNFESGSTSGWSLFNTVLTSGVPTGSIFSGASSITTFGVVSSGQLAGSYSLQTTGSVIASQGFLSDPFYIDTEDQGKVLTYGIYYKVNSGASNGNFSGTSSNTYHIYVYDVTNSLWIQPSGVYGIEQTSGAGYASGSFQATSNSTQYRLAIICVNSAAGSIDMYWDDFTCGPSQYVFGSPVTDWVPYTPTFSSGWGSVTAISMWYKIVGDSIIIRGNFTSGSASATQPLMYLPSGLTVDPSKITTNTIVGRSYRDVANQNSYTTLLTNGNLNYLAFSNDIISAANSPLTASGNTTGITNTPQVFVIETHPIPIKGFGSSVQMSDQTSTRVVAAQYSRTSSSAVAGSATLVFDTLINDTHNAFSTSTGRYTAPVPGYYRFGLSAYGGGGSNIDLNWYKNGSLYEHAVTSITTAVGHGTTTIYLNSGEYVEVKVGAAGFTPSAGGGGTVASTNYLTVERISGPSQIAASETIAARYYVSAGASTTSANPINYDTKSFDTHGAVTTGAGVWKFTAPSPGVYEISACLYSSAGSTDANLYVNGALYSHINGSPSSPAPGTGTDLVELNAGDYIQIRPNTTITPTSGGVYTVRQLNYINIKRVGNRG